MGFSPFTEAEGIDELYPVGIVEILGESLQELGVLSLKDGVIREGGLVPAVLGSEVLGTCIDHI